MIINKEICIGCEECIPYCGMGAIHITDGMAEVDLKECVECGICVRSNACAVDAFEMQPLEWPRILRQQFSDARAKHPSTSLGGRGTEEVKTNDVTGRIVSGELGFGIEMGRPGLGVWLKDVQTVSMAIAAVGAEWEANNPVTPIFKDKDTGRLLDDVIDEKVLSCILEFKVPVKKLEPVVQALRKAEKEIDTVFSASVIMTFAPDGTLPELDKVRELGLNPRPNPKVNLGFGRPRFTAR
jgi:NAD-dependent dihydropyrimidine dehydrogenase PreA subunit